MPEQRKLPTGFAGVVQSDNQENSGVYLIPRTNRGKDLPGMDPMAGVTPGHILRGTADGSQFVEAGDVMVPVIQGGALVDPREVAGAARTAAPVEPSTDDILNATAASLAQRRKGYKKVATPSPVDAPVVTLSMALAKIREAYQPLKVTINGAFGSAKMTVLACWHESPQVLLLLDSAAAQYMPPASTASFSLSCGSLNMQVQYPGLTFELPLLGMSVVVFLEATDDEDTPAEQE